MKNNFNKFMSLLLSLLMVANAMTFISFATSNEKNVYHEYVNNLKEENRILYLDNFDLEDGTDYTAKDSTTTAVKLAIADGSYTGDTDGRSHVDGNGIYSDLESREWYYEGIDTNLPLNSDSKYTIELEVKENSAHKHLLGLGWLMPTHDTDQRRGRNSVGFTVHDQADGTQIANRNTGWGVDWGITIGGTDSTRKLGYNTKEGKLDQFINYIIVIDGYTASLYIDGTCIISNATVQTGYDTTLSIFCMNYTSEAVSSNATDNTFGTKNEETGELENNLTMEIKNISVYNVLYESTLTTNANTGDLLLELDNFDLTDGNAFTSNYDIDVTKSEWSNADHDGTNSATVSGNVISSTRTTNNWYMAGVETTLPLDANSKYTIEFYVKELMPHALGLAWSNPNQVQAKDKQGFLMMDRGGANKGYDTNVWALDGGWGESKLEKEDGTEYHAWPGYNVTTKHKDAEGFVRYTITIDGNKVSLYVGGQLIVENAVFDIAQAENLHLGIHNWTAESKGQYGGEDAPTHKSGAETTPGAAVEVKNIRVWQGHTVRPNMVYAVLLDGTRQALFYGEDNMITEFPDAGGEVAEDEIVIWTYSNNNVANVVAIAPFEVTADVTFTAKKIKTSDNTIVGMQYTTPTENKQNVRFISTIHSLKGSAVGFEITARYMKNGALTEKSWDESSGSVYTSIKATAPSGTVKDISARDLGGTYLFAISVDEVLTNIGQIDFYVRSYVVVNGEKVYDSDKATVFSMNNGVYTSDATPLQNNAS